MTGSHLLFTKEKERMTMHRYLLLRPRNASHLAAVLTALLTVSKPLAAQDRLFIPDTYDSDGVEVGAVGRFGEVLGPTGRLARPLVGGGRFAVVVRGFDTTVYDLRTGQSRALPTGATAAAFDPARPRVFVVTHSFGQVARDTIGAFDVVTGVTTPIVDLPSCPSAFGPPLQPNVTYAAGTEWLFVERCAAAPATSSDVLVFDLTTSPAALRSTLSGSLPSGAEVLPSPDGTRLFVGSGGLFVSNGLVVAYDTASGAIVSSAAAPPGTGQLTMTWDDARQWLFISTSSSASFNESVSAWTQDLAPLGAAAFPNMGSCGVRLQTSPHTGRIYVATGGSNYYGAPRVGLIAFGGQPLALQGTASLNASVSVSNTCAAAVVRTAPGAPRNLRSSVTGRAVSVGWENVGGASRFVLEAGLGTGRTDVSVFLGPDPRVSFADVPPGTYYLRLRGANEFGSSHPSAELRLVVP